MKLDCKVSGTRRKPLDVARNREGVIDGTPFTPNNLNQYAETSNGSQHEMTGQARKGSVRAYVQNCN